MKANPEKFNFMVLSPYQKEYKNVFTLRVAEVVHVLTSVLQAPPLGKTFDMEPHVPNIIKKANSQLHTLLRMYCIDRAGVPETHDAHAFHCLSD